MLRKITVVNAMGLRAYEAGACLAKLQPQIAVVYENHRLQKSDDRPVQQSRMEGIQCIEFEQYRHGNGDEKNGEKVFQPILPRSGHCIELRIQMMHLMVLPKNSALVKAAVIPVEKEISNQCADQERADNGCHPFSAVEPQVDEAEL